MGGTTFMTTAKGKNAQEAFTNARADALHEYGHGGYTGSIAEKQSFTMIQLPDMGPEGPDAGGYAWSLIDKKDPRVDDKWGPAGCIDLGNGEFLFFGWASE